MKDMILVRFKNNTSISEFDGIYAEYYISDKTTKLQLDVLDCHINKLLDEYSNKHDGDFENCDYQEIIEKAMLEVNIKFMQVNADKVIYL